MKNFSKLLLITMLFATILVFSNQLLVQKVDADSGWDSSYDSGSSSSSSSSSSSWSSSSSSSSSGSSEFDPKLTFEACLSLGYAILVFLPLCKKKIKKKNIAEDLSIIIGVIKFLISFSIIIIWTWVIIVDLVLFLICLGLCKKIKIYDDIKTYIDITEDIGKNLIPDFNLQEFKDKTYKIFYDVQMAWMNFDYDNLKELLNNELYNTYYMDLEILKTKQQQNVMSDFDLIDIRIIGLEKNNDKIVSQVYLNVSFYDYVIDSNTNTVLRGTKSRKLNNEYILTFIKTENIDNNKVCPNCGAKIDGNATSECEHCHAKIVNSTYDWVMSNKKKISQK